MQTNKLKVRNIKCAGCVESISRKLLEIPGVSDVQVSIADSSVEYSHNGNVSLDEVISCLVHIGYPVQDSIHN